MPKNLPTSGSPIYLVPSTPDAPDGSSPNTVSLKEFAKKSLRKWYYFAVMATICTGILTSIATVLPKKYTASMIIGPAAINVPNFSGASGALSGATSSLLGSIAGGGNREFGGFIAILPTVATAKELSVDTSLMAALFPRDWDPESENWRQPSGTLFSIKSTIKSWLGYPEWSPPSAEDLVRLMEKDLAVSSLNQPGYYEVFFRARDPETARIFLERLYDIADSALKSNERSRLTARIAYLEQKIQSVKVAEYRQSLLSLLSQEEKKLLSTVEGLPYAAEVLSGPAAESRPSSPNIKAFLFGAPLLGFALASLAVFWRCRQAAAAAAAPAPSPRTEPTLSPPQA